MTQSITQYDLMSTSTCTPTGGGASQFVYQYRKEISTTTTSANLTPFVLATSTVNQEIVSMTQSILFIGIIFAVLVAFIVKKLV